MRRLSFVVVIQFNIVVIRFNIDKGGMMFFFFCSRCCSFCGRVVSEDNWSEEVTFAKDSSGQVSSCFSLLNFDML